MSRAAGRFAPQAGAWRDLLDAGGALRAGEILLWCLLAALAILLRAQVAGGPELTSDSYQYLVTAENWRLGVPAATSIVHFDPERTHGRIPAPLTTFPAGYPLLIALLSSAGLSGEQGGVLLSVLATLALIAMFGRAAAVLGVPPPAARVLIALLATSSALLARGNAVATEPLFAGLMFGALLLLLAAQSRQRTERDHLLLQLAANALIAGAFFVRYAGLFVFAAVAAFHAWRWLLTRTRRPLRALAAMSLSAALIGAGLWRNHLLVGSWKGGNTKEVDNDILEVLYGFARSMHHVFLGETDARFGIAEAVLAGALALLLAAALSALWRRRAALLCDPRLQLLAACIAVYTGAMLYLGAASMISFGPRMFMPLLPVLLLFAGGLCGHAAHGPSLPPRRRRALHGAAAALVAAYAGINFPLLLEHTELMPHHRVQARLEAPVPAGESLREQIEREVAPDAVLLATEGPATGYLLRRKLVSLVSPRFSDQAWTEDAVHATMVRFGARHLLVYQEPGDKLAAPSAFLRGLASGATPAWLQLVADNGRAKLFGRRDP